MKPHIAGRWTRQVRATSVGIKVTCQPAMTGSLRRAVELEAEAFGGFLGRDARLTISH